MLTIMPLVYKYPAPRQTAPTFQSTERATEEGVDGVELWPQVASRSMLL